MSRQSEEAEELVPLPVAADRPDMDRAGLDRSGRALGLGALPATGTWEQIPHPQSLAETPVWTGQDALFWVGRFDGSADGVWLYRP